MCISTGILVPRRASAARRAVSSVAVLGLSAAVLLAAARAPGQTAASPGGQVKPSIPAAQAASQSPSPAAQPAQEATPAKPAKGEHEGITVHGHWTIEVRNPDGKLVTHREFENSLVTTSGIGNGPIFLTGLLGRTISAGSWEIVLAASNGTMHISEPNSTISTLGCGAYLACSPTLSVVPGNSVSPGVLTLTGFVSVPTGVSSIVYVSTDNLACPSTFLPSVCFNLNFDLNSSIFSGYQFTSTTLSPAITITPGQVVQATVNFSFSSPS